MHACLRVRLNEPLFAGCHLPLTYIGMEYIRTNNLTLAEQVPLSQRTTTYRCHLAAQHVGNLCRIVVRQFLEQARTVCSTDPLVFNELGIILYKQCKYANAK